MQVNTWPYVYSQQRIKKGLPEGNQVSQFFISDQMYFPNILSMSFPILSSTMILGLLAPTLSWARDPFEGIVKPKKPNICYAIIIFI